MWKIPQPLEVTLLTTTAHHKQQTTMVNLEKPLLPFHRRKRLGCMFWSALLSQLLSAWEQPITSTNLHKAKKKLTPFFKAMKMCKIMKTI